MQPHIISITNKKGFASRLEVKSQHIRPPTPPSPQPPTPPPLHPLLPGEQFRARVEYAPCQRVPKQRGKKDPKEGTISTGARAQGSGFTTQDSGFRVQGSGFRVQRHFSPPVGNGYGREGKKCSEGHWAPPIRVTATQQGGGAVALHTEDTNARSMQLRSRIRNLFEGWPGDACHLSTSPPHLTSQSESSLPLLPSSAFSSSLPIDPTTKLTYSHPVCSAVWVQMRSTWSFWPS